MNAAKEKSLSPAGLTALRVLLLLVVALFLPQTRVWGFDDSPHPASGQIAVASASAVGEIAPGIAYDASGSLVAAETTVPSITLTPYQVHIDPITGSGPMAIDTSVFTSGETTLYGGIRNPRQFWKAWNVVYPETVSDANTSLIQLGRSPVVDAQWLETFPEHGDYLGETLIHHHLDYGPNAIPLPDTVHSQQPGWGIWHPEQAGE